MRCSDDVTKTLIHSPCPWIPCGIWTRSFLSMAEHVLFSSNKSRRCICNVISHWLRLLSHNCKMDPDGVLSIHSTIHSKDANDHNNPRHEHYMHQNTLHTNSLLVPGLLCQSVGVFSCVHGSLMIHVYGAYMFECYLCIYQFLWIVQNARYSKYRDSSRDLFGSGQ